MKFNAIKGFRDILPEDVGNWQRLEFAAREVMDAFGFQEIKLPIMERTELFSRSIGQETDIVSKEMYTLLDSKGRGMTLRPEATASVVRAYNQHRMDQNGAVQKLFTVGPMFRHERPQKGRFRQFYQVSAEMFGDPGPKSDADLIVMAMHLFDRLGLEDLELHLNSLGCPGCRSKFRAKLEDYLVQQADDLCTDCRRRAETNPLRVFDCKVEACNRIVSGAPSILEFLCKDCREHFDTLKSYLDSGGVDFVLNHQLVRGLDYYTRTTFEIQTDQLGAQNAVAGGGRYDGLVKLLGGPEQPAIGFAVGVDRIIALLEEKGQAAAKKPDLFIAALGEKAEMSCFKWTTELRKAGLWVEMDYGGKGLKSQMKKAGRFGVKKVLIIGEAELTSGTGVFRDMDTKEQEEIDLNNVLETMKKALKTND